MLEKKGLHIVVNSLLHLKRRVNGSIGVLLNHFFSWINTEKEVDAGRSLDISE